MLPDLISCLALKMDVEVISWLLCPLGRISLVTLNYQGSFICFGAASAELGKLSMLSKLICHFDRS